MSRFFVEVVIRLRIVLQSILFSALMILVLLRHSHYHSLMRVIRIIIPQKRDLVLLGSSHLFSLALNPNLLVKGFDDDNLFYQYTYCCRTDSSSLATTLHLIDLEFVDKTKSLGLNFTNM